MQSPNGRISLSDILRYYEYYDMNIIPLRVAWYQGCPKKSFLLSSAGNQRAAGARETCAGTHANDLALEGAAFERHGTVHGIQITHRSRLTRSTDPSCNRMLTESFMVMGVSHSWVQHQVAHFWRNGCMVHVWCLFVGKVGQGARGSPSLHKSGVPLDMNNCLIEAAFASSAGYSKPSFMVLGWFTASAMMLTFLVLVTSSPHMRMVGELSLSLSLSSPSVTPDQS